MKTIVLQSFRTHDVPRWLKRCLRSVRSWSEGNGWNYELLDDRFFDLAPYWAKEHCGQNIYAVTDICRLQWIKDKLAEGYQRVIWADADVLVFEPSRIDVSTRTGCAFAHELFLSLHRDGGVEELEGVNNSVMVFEQGQQQLDVYLEKSLEALRALPFGSVPRTALGPEILKNLRKERSLELLYGVGLFTFAIMRELALGGGALSHQLASQSPSPLGAANLCHFQRNEIRREHRPHFDVLYDAAVERLLASPRIVLR